MQRFVKRGMKPFIWAGWVLVIMVLTIVTLETVIGGHIATRLTGSPQVAQDRHTPTTAMNASEIDRARSGS